MDYTMEQYQQSAQALQQRLGDFRPRVLLILGSLLTGLPCDLDLIVVPIAVGVLSLYVALKGGL